jgi:transcriptional regulator with XRE-family HTH domain
MMRTPLELLQELGGRIKSRRVALGWTQQDAARHSGVAYRTWRRLENDGQASLEDMVKASVVLRCEESLQGLFPLPAATSLDDLLKQQIADAASQAPRVRVRRPRRP